MSESKSVEGRSSLLELTKFLGAGWKPVSVKTKRYRESDDLLQQTITLSYVKVTDTPEGEEKLNKESNLEIKVFQGD